MYDYCNKHASRVLGDHAADPALVEAVAKELARFYRLGQMSVIDKVAKAVSEADKTPPPGWRER